MYCLFHDVHACLVRTNEKHTAYFILGTTALLHQRIFIHSKPRLDFPGDQYHYFRSPFLSLNFPLYFGQNLHALPEVVFFGIGLYLQVAYEILFSFPRYEIILVY